MTQNVGGKGGPEGKRIGADTLREDAPLPHESAPPPGVPVGNMVQNLRHPSNRPAAVTVGFGSTPLKSSVPVLDAGPTIEIRQDSLAPVPVSGTAPTERAPSSPELLARPFRAADRSPAVTASSAVTLVREAAPLPIRPTLGSTPLMVLADTQLGETSLAEAAARHSASVAQAAASSPSASPRITNREIGDLELARTLEGPLPTGSASPSVSKAPTPPSPLNASRHETVLPRIAHDGAEPRLVAHARDRYERVKALGEGGVGEVLLARDHDIDRKVAIKTLKPDMQAPGHVIRFVDEVRTVGSLEHPNIVPIHDVGMDPSGQFFFVMKYVAGQTLEDVIAKLAMGDQAMHKRFPFEARVQVFMQVLRAVQYAHAQGIVHRDLKPANIMLGEFGEVMVMDWGLAKKIAQPEVRVPGDDQTLDEEKQADAGKGDRARLFRTRHGTLLGTPAYMSPEQARAEEVDQRSDLYSLGVILNELLTLQHYLHDRHTLTDMLAGVQQVELSGRALKADPFAGGVPAALIYFAAKAQEKDPAKRFQSAAEMAASLEDIQAGQIRVTCHVTLLRSVANKAVHFLDSAPHVAYVGLLSALGLAGYGAFSLISRLLH